MNKPNFKEFIQVAGVIDRREADLIINSGVNYLGFPLRLPVNKEDLTEEEAAKIIKNFKNPVYGVVISYSSTAEEVIELCDKLGTKIIQLHGPIENKELISLKSERPDIYVIKSLVISKNNVSDLRKIISETEKFVDAFITDTYDPETGASGATGKTHDWNISRQFVEVSSKPVILAGGLNPQNIYEAIKFVKPAGVDVHTGIEGEDGRKDRKLLTEFIIQAQKAFNEISI